MFGKIKKILILVIALMLISGCRSKKIIRDRTRTTQTGTITRKVPGDSIIVTRHYIDTIHKDTVIVNRTKFLNLIETYNKNGTLKIKCQQNPVTESEIYTRETQKDIKEKNPEPGGGFKDVYFFYIGLILAVLVIINKLLK